ncbi:unnamed protein product [Somion occarium]|uniref:Peptidase C14 caspase domain-containing protein n=1 Tax=Somion occarium TaxID=3059160 RepID=A0ABP1CT86_9APHY
MVYKVLSKRRNHDVGFDLATHQDPFAVLAKIVHGLLGIPDPNKGKPLTGEQRALLVGICYNTSTPDEDYEPMVRTHDDVKKMALYLIRDCYFQAENIVVMLDTPVTPEMLRPTKRNIEREMKKLCKDVRIGDSIVFHYAGHGDQVPANCDKNEIDGLDECIVPLDHGCGGNLLLDDVIHECLVSKFPVGAKLTMLFDCCHSQSMADLKHNLCNRAYFLFSKLLVILNVFMHFRAIVRKAREGIRDRLINGVKKAYKSKQMAIKCLIKKPQSMLKARVEVVRCDGLCRRHLKPEQDVMSLSACRDHEITYETEMQDGSFTQVVIRVLRDQPIITHNKLIHELDREVYNSFKEIHRWKHDYRQNSLPQECKSSSLPNPVSGNLPSCTSAAMKAFGWRPQLSSQEPLDMNMNFSFRLWN